MPAQMEPPITTKLGLDLKVEWVVPDSGSLPIEAYKVEILSYD